MSGMDGEETQWHLLQQLILTLSTAVKLADQFISARETAALLQAHSKADVSKTRKKSKRSSSSSSSSSSSISSSLSIVRKWGPCCHCGEFHNAFKCKFRDAECHQCGKKGHIKRVCRSRRSSRRTKVKAVAKDDGSNSEDEIKYVSHIEGINSKYLDDVERKEINTSKDQSRVDAAINSKKFPSGGINTSTIKDQSIHSGVDGQGSRCDQLKRGKNPFIKGPVDVNESSSIQGMNSKRKSSSRSVHHHSTQPAFGPGTRNSIVSIIKSVQTINSIARTNPVQVKNETNRDQCDQSIRSSSMDEIHAPVRDSNSTIPVSESGIHSLIAVPVDDQSMETRQFSSAPTHDSTMEPTTIKEPKPPPLRRSGRSKYGKKTDRSTYCRR